MQVHLSTVLRGAQGVVATMVPVVNPDGTPSAAVEPLTLGRALQIAVSRAVPSSSEPSAARVHLRFCTEITRRIDHVLSAYADTRNHASDNVPFVDADAMDLSAREVTWLLDAALAIFSSGILYGLIEELLDPHADISVL